MEYDKEACIVPAFTNWDYLKCKMHDEMIRNMLAFQWSFGISSANKVSICNNEDALIVEKESGSKEDFCENCIFVVECKNADGANSDLLKKAKLNWLNKEYNKKKGE